jgi:hypothetical protein
MNLPASLSGRASRGVVLAAMLLTLCRVVPAHGLAEAAGAGSHSNSSGARASLAADPVVDGAYVQAQLAYLVTRDLRREAGQDTDLPRARNGHDEFAADWLAALRSDLHGLPLRVSRQTFRLPGFRGRPPKTSGVNLIVTVPGTTRPHEWVLVVAHYDGTPFSTQSAFDDGSGCAILLGVARAMAPLWRLHRPARTVAFVLFDGEEQGLIGSFYYARVYRQGAPYRIVALYNEEQNGVGYPIRPFGLATNPTLPEHVFVTPQRHGSRWTPPVAPRFWPALRRFTAALVRARERAFAALHAVYPQLSYQPALSEPVFRPADDHLVPIGDDTIGGSDEVPLERLGLPTATFVSNYDYYARHHHPWSYPYDTARDTIALLERTAAGAAQPSSALAAALALPGQLTVEMLRDRAWGSDAGPV